MSQPLLMSSVGRLLHGKQLEVTLLLCFHSVAFHQFIPSQHTDRLKQNHMLIRSFKSNKPCKTGCCSTKLMQVCVTAAFYFSSCDHRSDVCVCIPEKKNQNGNKMPNEEISRKGNKKYNDPNEAMLSFSLNISHHCRC